MKKLMVLALALLLLTANATVSLAEMGIDFSGYSLDELLEIRAALTDESQAALAERKQFWGLVSIRLEKTSRLVSIHSGLFRMVTAMYPGQTTMCTRTSPCTNTMLTDCGSGICHG